MFERVLDYSIRQRNLVVILAVLLSLAGLQALRLLPIDAVPDITNNQVTLNVFCSGLAPEEVEKQVTYPIETALAGLPNLRHTRSLSRNEFAQVTAVFEDRADLYFVRRLVQERLEEVRDRLPTGVEPRLGPISTGLGEVLMWVVELKHPDQSLKLPSGRVMTTAEEKAMALREIQDWLIRPQLRTVPGLADVDQIGGYQRQFVVEPDPARLSALGLSLDTLVAELERNNQNLGAGFIEVRGQALTVRVQGRLSNEQEIEQVIVGQRHGIPLRISDLARVRLGSELRSGSATQNGSEVVIGTALMRIGENSRVVAQAVERRLQELQPSLPEGVRVRVVLNRLQLVDATIATVRANLFEGAVLVIAVLFAILGNFRAACIVALAIPISMLMTAIGMLGLGVSGNLMSLGAIDFGLIVDGSVIIVENSLRVLAEEQRRLGRPLQREERLKAVYAASCSVRNATAFGEAIIILVYVPILFLSGIEGKMFQPMALTVILALSAAFVLSLTLIPALVALALTGSVADREVPLLPRLRAGYLRVLQWNLRRPVPLLSLSLAALLLAVAVFPQLGQEFVPTLDEKNLAMHAIRPPGTGIEESTRLQQIVEKLVLEVPGVERVFSKTGTADLASDPMPPNVSDTFIMLKPRAVQSKAQLIEALEERVRLLPGHEFEFTQPIQMRFNELISGVRSDVAIKIFGEDFAQIQELAGRVAEALRGVPGAKDVRVEQLQGLPTLEVDPDRDALGRLGLDLDQLGQEVATAIRGRESGFILEGDRRFPVVTRLPSEMRTDLEALRALPIQLPGQPAGSVDENPYRFVPLRQLARVELKTGLQQVSRENGMRRIVVQANVRGRDLGGFVEEAHERVAPLIRSKTGVFVVWGGQYENLLEANRRLKLVIPICLLLILGLLYGSFSSLSLAALVFVGVPLALPGGVLALWLRAMPFSVSAAVGFIALSGVAVLNGLVLVSFIEECRQRGMGLDEALQHACSLRFRPILMTGLVAALGFLPMALSHGTGAEVQRPLATVVIGGLTTTTPLVLLVLPILYRFRVRGLKGALTGQESGG